MKKIGLVTGIVKLERGWVGSAWLPISAKAGQSHNLGGGGGAAVMGRGIAGELVVLPMLPRRPARICIMKSLAAAGLLWRKMVLVPPLVPMSLRVSKYLW